MRKRAKTFFESPILWVLSFYLISFLLGSIPNLLRIAQSEINPNGVFHKIENKVKETLKKDSRDLKQIEYLGIKENKLLVGASSYEDIYNFHLLEYSFAMNTTEEDIFQHLNKKGFTNISFTNNVFKQLDSSNELKIPFELNALEYTVKNRLHYMNEYNRISRLECGIVNGNVYSFLFDEENEETICYNYFSNEFKYVTCNIWKSK